MNEYVEILKRHVAENPPNYGSDAHSILEMPVLRVKMMPKAESVGDAFAAACSAACSTGLKIEISFLGVEGSLTPLMGLRLGDVFWQMSKTGRFSRQTIRKPFISQKTLGFLTT